MTTMELADHRFQMGRVAKHTFDVIGTNIVTFALLSLIPGLSLAVLGWGISSIEEGAAEFDFGTIAVLALAGLVYFAGALVLQVGVMHGTVASLNGARASLGECLGSGLRYLVPTLLIGLLAVLGVVAGLVLLIVPGLMLALMWIVAVPACVVEHTGVSGALRRSRELTRGFRWPIFGLYVVFMILLVLVTLALGLLTGANALASAPAGTLLETAGGVASTMISSVVSAALVASIYYELRVLKDGIGPEALASVFD